MELAQNAAGAPGLGTPGSIPPPPGPAPQRFTEIDQLKPNRGWTIPLPGAADTVDQGLFGVRQALADAGFSYLGIESATFVDNLITHGGPPGGIRANQQYSGQRPTYTQSYTQYLAYDLTRYGVPDGQIVLAGENISTNWDPGGPNKVMLATASYYQTLFNKAVELKFGYLANGTEFLGTQVGGSLAGGVFGVSAALTIEQGENAGVFSTPGVNVKFNLPNNYYDKVGVQRAISPDGSVIESDQNRSNVRFKTANSGVLVINEAGYRVPALPSQMQTWIRGATTFTSSRYIDQGSPLTRHPGNYGLFFLADRQLIQIQANAGPGSAARGLYAGFSAEYAPPYANRFSQYYEARLYGFGLIPGRPFDLASLVFNENVFSGDAIHVAQSRGQHTHNDARSYTASYSAHVYPGVNLNFGISYTDNPVSVTYVTNTGSALNVLVNTVTFF